MGYDINTGVPLFTRMLRGACNDKSTIEDMADLLEWSWIWCAIDRGLYSTKNLKILSENDNIYIIPVPSDTDIFGNAMNNVKYTDSFYYRSGKTHAGIEYVSQRIFDTEYVYVFQSNASMSAEEVFSDYKKHWNIETFYQYLKNKGNFNYFMIQD